ncbi:type II toxin-antitoxin system HigB family toxin [Pseudoduganella sp. DS3]|uniref:Type II toxin-antitoxin system HigB family toxin n=1 Tax=Pseudoduganella guangdongensis TaxID=2692179 RepID=A0A6N9HG78_9BURK|nr:type II toxin-antitoxin system HigB family toxin [Pseudoduganella guangdongensis]MYN02446.1 type II toxin-antitoxin system HigB family toxin [Pseudoduganella guangdongensis]
MRVISNKALLEFALTHIEAGKTLQTWRRSIELRDFANFAELKATFNSVDRVGRYLVFNVGGNKYRIVAAVHFDRRTLFVRHVFTHREYDSWNA